MQHITYSHIPTYGTYQQMADFYSPRSNDKEVDLEIEMSDENTAESVEEKRKGKKEKTKKESQDYNDQPRSDVCPYPWIHFEHTDKCYKFLG